MPFWSGETLWTRNFSDKIIEPFDPKWIDCGSYILHMGEQVFITPHERVRQRYQQELWHLKDGDSFSIPPGQFAFLLTKEYLRMPRDVVAFISLRSRVKFRGLINVSGFHVDPGFQGRLIYAVYNTGPNPILLDEGEPLFVIWFADLDRKDTEHYRRQSPQTQIGIDVRSGVPGQILSLQSLSEHIERLDRNFYRIIYGGIIAVAVASLAFFALAVDWGKWLHLVPEPTRSQIELHLR
jgi:dCTP deaminase